jgi:hypothetical protein
MTLSYTMHKNGRADIVHPDPEKGIVGKSRRVPFPLGGYIYEITANDGKRVYKGNRMSTGLANLETYLAATPEPRP